MPQLSAQHAGKDLARRIRQAAVDFNISIRQVMKDLGVSRTSFYRWEEGLNVPPPGVIAAFRDWVTSHSREPDNICSIRQLWASMTQAGIPCWYCVGSAALELRTAPDKHHRTFVLTCMHTGRALKVKMVVAGVETTLAESTLNAVRQLGDWLVREWGGKPDNTAINTSKRDVNLDRLESGIKRFMSRRKLPNDYANTTVRAR